MQPFLSQTTDKSNDKVMTNTTVMRISPQWASLTMLANQLPGTDS